MAKYKIVIEFESDEPIPEQCLNQATDAAAVQLEGLSDGDISDLDYTLTSANCTRIG